MFKNYTLLKTSKELEVNSKKRKNKSYKLNQKFNNSNIHWEELNKRQENIVINFKLSGMSMSLISQKAGNKLEISWKLHNNCNPDSKNSTKSRINYQESLKHIGLKLMNMKMKSKL